MPLTDAKIRTAKPDAAPIKMADGGGLYLEVRTTGAKLWRYRYRIAGKENVFAIGEYPVVSLAEARAEHAKARALVASGVHPSHNRKVERLSSLVANANTFEAVANEWIAKKSPNWTAYYTGQVTNVLKADVYPYVGKLPIRNVTAAHLLEIIRRVEARGATTVALLVRQWSSVIFRYAVATRSYGKKIGGALGAAAGIGSGMALVLSGADIRAASASAADPVGAAAGGFAGGVLAVLKSGSAGCAAGAAFGDVIDEHVLDKYRCVECGHAFSQPV